MAAPKTDMFNMIGVTSAPLPGGFTAEGFSKGARGRFDDEFDPNLKGGRAQKIYKEMREGDGTFGTCVATSMALFCSVPWLFKSRSDSPRGRQEQEFAWQVWTDMFHKPKAVLTDAYSFVWHGFNLHEIMWKRRVGQVLKKDGRVDRIRSSAYSDGRMGIADLAPRPQGSLVEWLWDEEGVLSHFVQSGRFGIGRRAIPMDKLLHVKTENAQDNPEGRSFYRSLVRGYGMKKRLEEFEAIGVQKEISGVLTARVPWQYLQSGGPYASALTTLKGGLSAFQRGQNEFIMWPSSRDADGKDTGWDIQTLPGSMSKYNIDGIVKRWDHRIAALFNMQFIDFGGPSQGSQALSVDQTNMYELTVNTVLDLVMDAINEQVFEPMWEMNGVPPEFRSDLAHGPVSRKDLEKFARTMQLLIDGGTITPDTALEVWTRDEMGYPPMDAPTEGNDTELVTETVEDDSIPQREDESEPEERLRAWIPSEQMQAAARKALDVLSTSSRKHDDPVAVLRAKDIAAGRPLGPTTVQRMVQHFSAGADKRAPGWRSKGPEWQAWHLWGGDAGKRWAEQVLASAKAK